METISYYDLSAFDRFYLGQADALPTDLVRDSRDDGVYYFDIFLQTSHPAHPQIDIRKTEFFKLVLLTGGVGELTYGTETFVVRAPSLMFIRPLQVKRWQMIEGEQEGHYCIFSRQFYSGCELNFQNLESGDLYGLQARPVLQLHGGMHESLVPLFFKIEEEMKRKKDYNHEIVRRYLHILLFEAIRMVGQQRDVVEHSAGSVLTEKFLKLLNRQFDPKDVIYSSLKFPSDYADHLSVHKNYLNAMVKMCSGKTVSDHIHERLLAEARLLLRHSQLNVSEIACQLGFKETAHFSNYFKKYQQISPLSYKKQVSVI
jgi:AraC family transcriptional activator of pobA